MSVKISCLAAMIPLAAAFAAVGPVDYDDTLLDSCWMWGHETGQVDGPAKKWGLDVAKKYYHMADACRDMGLYNLNVVRWDKPDRSFRDSLKGLKRLTWPVSGHPVEKHSTYRELGDYDFTVADEMPNVVGFELDDYFAVPQTNAAYAMTPKGRVRTRPAVFPYADLKELRERMTAYGRKLELRLVVYDGLFRKGDPRDLVPTLDLCDTVTYWVWRAKDIPDMMECFNRYRELAPSKPTLLGIYLWDFGGEAAEMPEEMIALQLETGLGMWRRGEIDGFVFLCSSICNRDLPAVKYAREWIRRHGKERRKAK